MTEIARITEPVIRLQEMFSKMQAPEEDSPIDRRSEILQDGSILQITKVTSTAQTSYGVKFQDVYFSMAGEEFKHLNLPNGNLKLGNQTVPVDIKPFAEFKDPTEAGNILMDWVEGSLREGKARPFPVKFTFAK